MDAGAGLFQLVPSLANLAASLASTSDEAKRNAQLIEFQKALIGLNSMVASVQQENATLRGQKHDAEEELKRMKDWEGEKVRYQLVAPFPACMVFALKKSMSNGESPHYLCTTCFENGERSYLQGREGYPRPHGGRVNASYYCQKCQTEAFTSYTNVQSQKYFEDIKPVTEG